MHRHCSRAMVPFRDYEMNCWAHEPMRNIFCPAKYTPFAALEENFRDMDNQFNQFRREMNSMYRSLYGGDQGSFMGLMKPEVMSEGDEKKYCLNVHMGNIPPENVKVSLKDRLMTVEAKVEEKSEDGNRRVYQEISRQFTLPENVDLKEVKSKLTPEGILRIEAPLPPNALPELPKPQEIPITFE